MKALLTRIWDALKAAPWLLLALASAWALARAARSADGKAAAARREAESEMARMGSRKEVDAYVRDQHGAVGQAKTHAAAANLARSQADTVIASIESAGHRSVADLARRWNREPDRQ